MSTHTLTSYEPTHLAVSDRSPAMFVRAEGNSITLTNEDGEIWTDPQNEWLRIEDWPEECPGCGCERLKYVPLDGHLPWECTDCGHLFDLTNDNLVAREDDAD